ETGKNNIDYETVEKFLQSENEQIRKAAINSLVVLDKERSVAKLLALMLDESISVASAARKGLAKCCRFIESEELWRLYSANKNAKIKYGILRIIGTLPKWDRLGYCLLACKNDDENIRKLALEILLAWQQKYGGSWKFTRATTIQKERIKLAAPLVSGIISGRKFQDLHMVIDSI
ncbi:MAG: HEAT repeat domain-containing protein, partial [Candidatus Obscuribacterales bacterium]|nr:HEAT repeat domain-containing protein [Candidatus Obscuribacterales bacterium]